MGSEHHLRPAACSMRAASWGGLSTPSSSASVPTPALSFAAKTKFAKQSSGFPSLQAFLLQLPNQPCNKLLLLYKLQACLLNFPLLPS